MEKLTLACDLWVPAPIDEVWAFASEPKNLAAVSPEPMNFRVGFNGPLVNGARIEIHFTPPGIPGEISCLSIVHDVISDGPKRQFVDIQNEGPFAYWKHQHLFEAGVSEIQSARTQTPVKLNRPGTWIRDRVEYSMPLGLAGKLVNKYFAHKQMADMFAHRCQRFTEIFSK